MGGPLNNPTTPTYPSNPTFLLSQHVMTTLELFLQKRARERRRTPQLKSCKSSKVKCSFLLLFVGKNTRLLPSLPRGLANLSSSSHLHSPPHVTCEPFTFHVFIHTALPKVRPKTKRELWHPEVLAEPPCIRIITYCISLLWTREMLLKHLSRNIAFWGG